MQVSPERLVHAGVTVSRVIQSAGEFVVIFPQSFTANVGCGFSVSESLHLAPASWFPLGCSAAQVSAAALCMLQFSILNVCSHISKRTRPNFTKFSLHVTCGHGSILLWGLRAMQCIMYFCFFPINRRFLPNSSVGKFETSGLQNSRCGKCC